MELMRKGLKHWKYIEEKSGRKIIIKKGLLDMGKIGDPELLACIKNIEKHDDIIGYKMSSK